jgi:glycosyltransferase involved in cell wall biosynthesis
MTEPIRFSIVIPAYNAVSTIAVSVESCLAQTYPAFEIIVINDGSNDGTVELLESRFGSSIHLVHIARNGGPSAARNAGIRLATGTHIAFQDADDTWHREKLAHIAEVLKRNAHIRFLFHAYTLSPVDFLVDAAMLEPAPYPMWKLLMSNPIGTPCVVIRRSDALPFNERLHYMEDYELFLRLADEHGVYRLAAPFTALGRPILSSGGQSSRRWKMRVGEIRAWWSLAKQRGRYLFVLPLLIVFALSKHVVKAFFPPRTNY